MIGSELDVFFMAPVREATKKRGGGGPIRKKNFLKLGKKSEKKCDL